MAITINSVLDTPDYKIIDVIVPEVDAINQTDAFTFAGAGLSNMRETPQVYWMVPATTAAAAPTGQVTCSIEAISTTGFTATKTSATIALSGQSHTFRLFMMSKRFYEL